MTPLAITHGQSPIVLGMPHVGTFVPEAVRARLNDEGRVLRDTDWHVDRLYADLIPGLTVVRANFHRYVIDANRDPSGQSLYPGASTTGLVPMTNFDGDPIWHRGAEPTAEDIALPCRTEGRTRPGPQPARRRDPLGLSFDPVGHSVALRRHAAGFQHRHKWRRKLRCTDRGYGRRRGRSLGPHQRAERTLQGRLDHSALWPARGWHPRDPDGTRAVEPSCDGGASLRA